MDYTPKYILSDVNEVITSENTEQLLVQAASENKLYAETYSCTYPEDIIYYDINNDSSKYSWACNNGCGIIYRRIDTKRNISCYYDWRNIRFYRYNVKTTNIPTWNSTNFKTYSVGSFIMYNGGIWQLHKQIPETITNMNVPDTEYFSEIFNSGQVSSWPLTAEGQKVYYGDKYNTLFPNTDETPKLYYTFNHSITRDVEIKWANSGTRMTLPNLVFRREALNIKIAETINTTFMWTAVHSNFVSLSYSIFRGLVDRVNAKSYFIYNIIDAYFVGNEIGIDFRNNVIGANFEYNIIGNDMRYNRIGDNFQYNTIGDRFQMNIIGNNFFSNLISNGFMLNRIASTCRNNALINMHLSSSTIGKNFTGNTTIGTNIGNCLTQLIVDDYFMNNIIHCNIAADLCGYSQLYKHTAGSPQITEYGGFTITPSQFESDGQAKAWVANKINPDGTISTFTIV